MAWAASSVLGGKNSKLKTGRPWPKSSLMRMRRGECPEPPARAQRVAHKTRRATSDAWTVQPGISSQRTALAEQLAALAAGRLAARADVVEPDWRFWERRSLNLHRVVGL